MSSEAFWDLFTETGEITFYLLYLKTGLDSAPDKRAEPPEIEKVS